ncbi:monosaccharide ABC transporter membrane protein (CUT2 family) [Lachnotalea glycerini]|uniref:ABC transporter permease n=1 Tax=Lachnotalea glycerini TaxID=1763509 RepID=A0A255IIG3_9FIRM|nr:ABC transporter permease [Lachnotalea glycerini]OYO42993.1 ribonucleotide-diphosphate reductase subunit alpha [Lachnotalea glycerini]PXV84901.1 monosaccharide ABC transporter membrane protein (CUT2 family) [Lachnotalea glycerini]RDY29920.1 ABC transporter permease [Lachnotalea glycerini]
MKQSNIRRLISLGLLLVLMIAFSISSTYFLTAANLLEIFRDASVVGIIGIGVTMVIITGGIDLSTGSIMALVGMTIANVYRYTLLPIWIMILIGILVGVLAGLFNGFIITRLHLPEFIATLSTMSIYRAITYLISIKENGVIKSQALKSYSYIILGKSVGNIYYVILAFIILAVIGQIILKYTRYGTTLYAVGSNMKAAQLSKINTERTRTIAYVITGACAAVGAVFTTARMQSTTALLGQGMEFEVIAAVVVGGCSLAGGRGDIIGTFIGALFMATLDNGIYKFQINTAYQLIIKGIIIICIVVFDSWYNKYMDATSRNKKVKEEASV